MCCDGFGRERILLLPQALTVELHGQQAEQIEELKLFVSAECPLGRGWEILHLEARGGGLGS